MESTSSGNFNHYSNPAPVVTEEAVFGRGKKLEEVDTCDVPLPNVRLEEIDISEYFSAKRTVPSEGTTVQIRNKLVGSRIAVETNRGNLSIGFLPTQYSYLLSCLRDGYKYKGKVTSSSSSPTPRIVIDLRPA